MFVDARVTERAYKDLLPVGEGDLVVDCSVGTDTAAVGSLCVARGAMMVNSAIEDWLADGWTPTDNPLDESMFSMHSYLVEQVARVPGSGRVCCSMGCNPGNVSLWVRRGLEWMAARFRDNVAFDSYSDMAKSLGVQTVQVSELDTQTEDGQD